MLRGYVETSVWGMVHPMQSAALREATCDFLAECRRGVFQTHISDVVISEIQQASGGVQEEVLRWIAQLEPVIVEASPDVDALAERFIAHGILSPNRRADARHVACAVVHGLDLLVSWNYRHIANVRRAEQFHAVALLAGWPSTLSIHTPLEVLDWK